MDFIKGIAPSNPIDKQKQERIAEISKEILEKFAKNYLLATKVRSTCLKRRYHDHQASTTTNLTLLDQHKNRM